MRTPRFLALLALATLTLCAASFADTNFDFTKAGTVAGDVGSAMYTVNAGPASVTLYGFSAPMATPDTHIYIKTGGGDENGAGLVNDPTAGEDEIAGTSFIQFKGTDLTDFSIGSSTGNDSWILYGSSTLGTLGTSLMTGTAELTDQALPPLPAGDTYYSLTAHTGNVLLADVSYSVPTPEPGTTAMIMTLGLVGLFEVGRRKLMA
jgi:hypothetical protein